MDAGILKRMTEVEQAVLDLDESVRGAAFLVMQEYILDGKDASSVSGSKSTSRRRRTESQSGLRESPATTPKAKVVPPTDFNGFIDEFESSKPADNAKAIAAHLYREYGIEPFSLDEVRELAATGGVTIPSRIDMTFLSAKVDKKKLFKRAGAGQLRPTVYGEAHFKETYGVKKGNKKRPPKDEIK